MTGPAGDETPGLRERKRLATRRAIQLAAVSIARERGLDATTVDEIARVADVSPRTFFNYFSSKEEAVVGDGPELPPDEAQAVFVADRAPIFRGLARLISVSITPALSDHEIVQLRRVFMKSHPELAGRRWATMHRFEAQVIEVVTRRLVDEFPALEAEPESLARRARLTALLAIAAMRSAWVTWMEDNGEHGTLLERLDETFDLLPDIVTTSVRA